MSGKTLYFVNNGEFDVRTMLTFGISAKANASAIGFFGTGLKYAIAITLRLGGTISIFNSKTAERFLFTSTKIDARGKEFDLVQVNGDNAGFTTHLGATWEPWQAYRELRCNAFDEGGFVTEDSNEALLHDVVVAVECAPIAEAHANVDMYFLTGVPIMANRQVEVYARPSANVYYKGVAVAPLNKPSPFAYNILSEVKLTENRTAEYGYQWLDPIRTFWLTGVKDRDALYAAMTHEQAFEWTLTFPHDWTEPSEEFIAVARELVESGRGVNDAVRSVLRKRKEELGEWPRETLSALQEKQLKKASEFLRRIGVNVSEFPVLIVSGLGSNVMGRALNGKIYLSLLPFEMGTKQVASTLMEEYVHNKLGCEDFDRRMQNWLFDKILSVTEELVGDPL